MNSSPTRLPGWNLMQKKIDFLIFNSFKHSYFLIAGVENGGGVIFITG